MSDPVIFKYPGRKSELESRTASWSRDLSLPVSWLQQYITSCVLSAMLGRARAQNGSPLFVIKGGTAMLIRFGADARATKDFDTSFRGTQSEILHSLSLALSKSLWNFDAHVRELDPYHGDRLGVVVYRYEISFKYLGDSFNTIRMEVTLQSATDSDKVDAILDLSPVRLPLPTALELLAIGRQIGEKWHACTEPDRDGIPNERVTDIYDLHLLFRAFATVGSMSELLMICEEIFVARGIHPWPAKISVRAGWQEVWANLRRNLPLEALEIPMSLEDAIDDLNQRLLHKS